MTCAGEGSTQLLYGSHTGSLLQGPCCMQNIVDSHTGPWTCCALPIQNAVIRKKKMCSCIKSWCDHKNHNTSKVIPAIASAWWTRIIWVQKIIQSHGLIWLGSINYSADLSSVKQFKIIFNENLVKLHWPLLLTLINLIPAWISNHIPDTMRDEINHPFPNFNGCAVEVREWIQNFIPHFKLDVITYPCWD